MRHAISSRLALALPLALAACGGAQDDEETTPISSREPVTAPGGGHAESERLAREADRPRQPTYAPTSDPTIEPTTGDHHAGVHGGTMGDDRSATQAERKAAPTAGERAVKVEDGEVAGFMAAANRAEIEAGELARTRAQSAEVKKFAALMVKDHGKNKKDGKALFGAQNIRAAEGGDLTRELTSSAQRHLEHLRGVSGAEFDRAYIDSQVEMHQNVIETLDTVLLPSAQNTELRRFLTDTRPILVQHLEHARKLQGSLGSGGY
jgi:putative membrane protein